MNWYTKIPFLNEQGYERYLPSAFDESLTLLQKVNKVIEGLNHVISAMNNTFEVVDGQNDAIQTIRDDFEVLKAWLESEGLQEKVVVTLNEWFDSGKLASIINTEVFDMKVDTETFLTYQTDNDQKLDSLEGQLAQTEQELTTQLQQTEQELTTQLTQTKTRLSDLVINIKDFLESDRTDDTLFFEEAITHLSERGGGTLFLPNGQYNLRRTLTIPSNISLVGANKAGVTVMFHNNGSYDIRTPLETDGITNRYRYKIGIKTESFGSHKNFMTENISFKNITFDWNNVDSEPYSIAPIAIDSAKNVYFENIEVKRAYNTFSSMAGCNVLVSFSENVFFERTILNGADYESLSVRYLSKNVRFNNGAFYSNKASMYGGQTHLFQVATPPYAENWLQSNFGEYKAGTLYVTNSIGIIEGSCSHFGTAHTGGGLVVDSCEFISKGNSQLFYGLKTFSNSDGSRFTNNKLRLYHFATGTIPNALALDDSATGTGGNSNFEISGNEVEITFPDGFYPQADLLNTKPIIGGMDKTTNYNGLIKNNVITVRNYPNRPIRVIGVMGNRLNISDNVISTQEPGVENDGGGMYAIYVSGLVDSIIKGNIQGGQKISTGVRFESDSDIKRNIIVDNVFGWVVDPTGATSGYTDNIIERNYSRP